MASNRPPHEPLHEEEEEEEDPANQASQDEDHQQQQQQQPLDDDKEIADQRENGDKDSDNVIRSSSGTVSRIRQFLSGGRGSQSEEGGSAAQAGPVAAVLQHHRKTVSRDLTKSEGPPALVEDNGHVAVASLEGPGASAAAAEVQVIELHHKRTQVIVKQTPNRRTVSSLEEFSEENSPFHTPLGSFWQDPFANKLDLTMLDMEAAALQQFVDRDKSFGSGQPASPVRMAADREDEDGAHTPPQVRSKLSGRLSQGDQLSSINTSPNTPPQQSKRPRSKQLSGGVDEAQPPGFKLKTPPSRQAMQKLRQQTSTSAIVTRGALTPTSSGFELQVPKSPLTPTSSRLGFESSPSSPMSPTRQGVNDGDLDELFKTYDTRRKRTHQKHVSILGLNENPRPRRKAAEAKPWHNPFSPEMEAEYSTFFYAFNLRQLLWLYALSCMYMAIAAIYYSPLVPAISPLAVNARNPDYLVFAAAFAVSLVTLGILSFITLSPSLTQRVHSVAFTLIGFLLAAHTLLHGSILPEGPYYMWAFMTYTLVGQNIRVTLAAGIVTSALSWVTAIFLTSFAPVTWANDCANAQASMFPCWNRIGAALLLYICINFSGFVFASIMNLYNRKTFCKQRTVLEQRRRLIQVKVESDKIALSILPQKVWQDLRSGQHQRFVSDGAFHRSLMYRHEEVTILFADIAGFTAMSSKLRAEEVVEMLNSIFFMFDTLVEKYVGLEKIKTLGDCYILCAGVPQFVPDHVTRVVAIALEMVKKMDEFALANNYPQLGIRVGIHTGQVMAGLIGTDKLTFDIWSNDVTAAMSMEHTGEVGRVHISQSTRVQLDEGVFELEDGPDVHMPNNPPGSKPEPTFFVTRQLNEFISFASIPYVVRPAHPSINKDRRKSIFFSSPTSPNLKSKQGGSNEEVYPVRYPSETDESSASSTTGSHAGSKHSSIAHRTDNATLKRQNTIFTTGRFKAKLKEELTADEMDLLTYARDSLHLLSVSLEFEDRALETEYRQDFVNQTSHTFIMGSVVVYSIALLLIAENCILLLSNSYAGPLAMRLLLVGQGAVCACQLPAFAMLSLRVTDPVSKGLRARSCPQPSGGFLQWSTMLTFIIMLISSLIYVIQIPALFPGTSSSNFDTTVCSADVMQDKLFIALNVEGMVLLTIMTLACFIRLKSMWVITLCVVSLVSYTLTMMIAFRDVMWCMQFDHLIYIGCVIIYLMFLSRRVEKFVRNNYLMSRLVQFKNLEIEDIQMKTRRLLINLLPKDIVNRLFIQGTENVTIADSHTRAAVLFCSIANFTTFDAASMQELNEVVTRFDELAHSFGIEKIKMIGNTYMCATGISAKHDENYLNKLGSFALAMRDLMDIINQEFSDSRPGHVDYVLRIGIDTGPLVAGVIGRTKLAFDIWGHTVNMASRMESTGVDDKIQVTDTVRSQLHHHFHFEQRPDQVVVKGAGTQTTYFLLKARHPPAL